MTKYQHGWDAWIESREGRECADITRRLNRDTLENRLFAAYTAGFIAHRRPLTKRVKKTARRRRGKK